MKRAPISPLPRWRRRSRVMTLVNDLQRCLDEMGARLDELERDMPGRCAWCGHVTPSREVFWCSHDHEHNWNELRAKIERNGGSP